MECDICSKDGTARPDFFCVSCARSAVYLSRLELARSLMETEGLRQQVSTIVEEPSGSQSVNPALENAQKAWKQEVAYIERAAAVERAQTARTHSTALRSEIEELKSNIAQQKKQIATKRRVLQSIQQNIPSRRQTHTEVVSGVRENGASSLSTISHKSISTRAFLCREAAILLRLRQRKKSKEGEIIEQYSITGLVLPDLKDINNIRCTDLTAVLTNVANLLVLVAFYLGIRLPAEITIPHRDYPLPTINTPSNSYLGSKVAFPGSGSLTTAPSSPFSSRHDVKAPYRPRPLFIGSDDQDEKIAQFAKRDPTAFSFFVEGVSLLAWNIAWLSRSQGFVQGTTSWEDICDIGRNLHQLIIGQPQSPALLRVLSNRDAQRRKKQGSGSSTPSSTDGHVVSFAKLGQVSHLSAQSFLGQGSTSDLFRNWKYSKFNTIADSLKKMLLTEMNNAEWEVLQEQEYLDGGEQFDEAVMIRARAADGRENTGAQSIMNMKTLMEEQSSKTDDPGGQAKAKGKSGWTKVKSRNEN